MTPGRKYKVPAGSARERVPKASPLSSVPTRHLAGFGVSGRQKLPTGLFCQPGAHAKPLKCNTKNGRHPGTILARTDPDEQPKSRTRSMKRALYIRVAALLLGAGLAAAPFQAFAFSRVKDLVAVEGIRDNTLVGYGLVVGLNGTGDSLKNAPFTQLSMQTMLERMGVNTRGTTMQTKDVAAVMVTASLPAFAATGTHVDISVSAMGDAKSLQGGTLLATTLFGADGQIYAIGQGPVAISGFVASGAASSVTQGVPTAGRISNGAIVEKETGFQLASQHTPRLALHNPDLTTASRIAIAVNSYIGGSVAEATDPSTVRVTVPDDYPKGVVGLLTDLEQE